MPLITDDWMMFLTPEEKRDLAELQMKFKEVSMQIGRMRRRAKKRKTAFNERGDRIAAEYRASNT